MKFSYGARVFSNFMCTLKPGNHSVWSGIQATAPQQLYFLCLQFTIKHPPQKVWPQAERTNPVAAGQSSRQTCREKREGRGAFVIECGELIAIDRPGEGLVSTASPPTNMTTPGRKRAPFTTNTKKARQHGTRNVSDPLKKRWGALKRGLPEPARWRWLGR